MLRVRNKRFGDHQSGVSVHRHLCAFLRVRHTLPKAHNGHGLAPAHLQTMPVVFHATHAYLLRWKWLADHWFKSDGQVPTAAGHGTRPGVLFIGYLNLHQLQCGVTSRNRARCHNLPQAELRVT